MNFKKEQFYLLDEEDFKIKGFLEHYVDCLMNQKSMRKDSFDCFKPKLWEIDLDDLKMEMGIQKRNLKVVCPSSKLKLLESVIVLISATGKIREFWHDFCDEVSGIYYYNLTFHNQVLQFSFSFDNYYYEYSRNGKRKRKGFSLNIEEQEFDLFPEWSGKNKSKVTIFFNQINKNEFDFSSLIIKLRQIEMIFFKSTLNKKIIQQYLNKVS